MKTAILALTIFLSMTIFLDIYAQQQSISRHTPGFPYNQIEIDKEILDMLLNITSNMNMSVFSEADINELYRSIDNISKGVKDIDIGLYEDLEGLKSLINTYNLSELEAIDKLYKDIENEDLRNILKDVVSSYRVDRYVSSNDIENLYRVVIEMYRRGLLDKGDVLKALEILFRISNNLNYGGLTDKIGIERVNIVKEIIDRVIDFQNPMRYSNVAEISIGEEIRESSVKGFNIPLLYPILPSLDYLKDIAVIVGIAMLAIVTAISMHRLWRYIEKLIIRYIALRNMSKALNRYVDGFRKSVVNYWLAIEFIEKRYGLVKGVWMTHREYLDRVRKSIAGNVVDLFSRLTMIYEVARFGGVEDESLDRESEYILKSLGEEI
uniref:DUF4129 domain-containing protein n=2 Tax=Ignisphaera aggregans TaxID=334771 RepID=A0A7C5YYX7_9CREN